MHRHPEGRMVSLSHERIARIQAAAEAFRRNAGREGLWQHQSSAMEALAGFFHESVGRLKAGASSSGAIVMPTGCGKTVVAAETAKALGLRAAVLAPTVQIALQHFEELRERAPDVRASLYYGGSKDLGGDILVTTYPSALSLYEAGRFPETDIAFYDEAHRSLSEKRMQLHGNIAPIGIGLTATPAFSPMRQIWSAFDDVIYDLSIREAVEMGAMSSIRGFILETSVDASGAQLRRQGNLLDESQAERVLNVFSRNRAARDFYLEHFKGEAAVVFCITQSHAEEFASFLRDSGVRASSIHGRIPGPERERRLEAFEDGSIEVLTTRDVLIEGWDSKRVLIELCLRPTYSLAVKTHMVGRVARQREGKEAGIVVEFQDAYRSGEQPVLAHHVLDLPAYRQGGLLAAPRKKLESEERALRRNLDVAVRGSLKVSFAARKVFGLDSSSSILRNPALLREILSTATLPGHASGKVEKMRSKPGLAGLSFSTLNRMRLSHPEFSGTLQALAWRVFGLKREMGLDFPRHEDYLHLINYAHDDWPRQAHDLTEALPTSGSIGISAPPDEICDNIRQKAVLAEILGSLPGRQAAVFAHSIFLNPEKADGSELTYKEMGGMLGLSAETVRKNYFQAYKSLFKYPIRKRTLAFNGEESPNAEKVASAVLDERIPLVSRETMLHTLRCCHPSDRIGFFAKVLDGPFSLDSRKFFGVMLVHELKEHAKAGKGRSMELSAISHDSRHPWRVRRAAFEALDIVQHAISNQTRHYQYWRHPEAALDAARNPDFHNGLRSNAGLAYVDGLRVNVYSDLSILRGTLQESEMPSLSQRLNRNLDELKAIRDDDSLPGKMRSVADHILRYSVWALQKLQK